jgi:two-component system phosphate regulon sensor histidine kinase PhoR
MLTNPRPVAFLLAVSVCLITTAFLSLVNGAGMAALLVAGGISFASAFILFYITLEFLIFREIKQIYQSIDKINRKEFKSYVSEASVLSNPLRKVNQEIYNYASRKQKEIDELKKIEAFRREFIADISHELKTPLFAAQGFVLTLLDGAIDDENVRYKFLKKAAKSLEGLSVLVQDLLTLSQIESGDIVMQFENFDLQELVQDVIDQLEEKARKRDIHVSIAQMHEGGVFVYADYPRIGQVITNLISNAIKYGNDEGKVLIDLQNEGSHILVSVSDDGPGIAREHLRRIFERFYRVEKSRSRKQGGSGLGLAIVKHIVEKHNAQINVISEVGKGTTFSFRLQSARD